MSYSQLGRRSADLVREDSHALALNLLLSEFMTGNIISGLPSVYFIHYSTSLICILNHHICHINYQMHFHNHDLWAVNITCISALRTAILIFYEPF